MSREWPNYATLEPPADTPEAEYDCHARRAAIFDVIVAAGSPQRINQRALADRFDVAPSTISNDMDRLAEAVDQHLADDVALTGRALFDHVTRELLHADDWEATREAFDVFLEWSEFLADRGEIERAPDRAAVDVRQRSADDAYVVVDSSDLELADGGDGAGDDPDVIDDAAGFTETPAAIDVTPTEATESDRDQEADDDE